MLINLIFTSSFVAEWHSDSKLQTPLRIDSLLKKDVVTRNSIGLIRRYVSGGSQLTRDGSDRSLFSRMV